MAPVERKQRLSIPQRARKALFLCMCNQKSKTLASANRACICGCVEYNLMRPAPEWSAPSAIRRPSPLKLTDRTTMGATPEFVC
mmetsp:Transcript_32968/g.97196  ORF Transcript_32968/g.97196 Transcript_32968/m.97196 type:complete len:84 (+) Transcript_32968:3418-3669(+)